MSVERNNRLRAVISGLSLAERFQMLHDLGIYHHPESVSGAASTLSETAALREALPPLMSRYGIASVLDIPCGDFHWMQHVTVPDYTGADIVPEIVAANRASHETQWRRFQVLDATRDPLV